MTATRKGRLDPLMSNALQVVVLGTGQMGTGIIELLRKKKGLELAGVYGRRPRPAATDVGHAIGLDEDIGLEISNDLTDLLTRTKPQVAIHATCSRVEEAMGEFRLLLGSRVNVISIAEEMAYPACQSPRLAEEIHELAVAHDVTVLGTGINPGFVLDLLVITLTGVCQRVESISAKRLNDLSPYGPTVLKSQGVDLTPEAFASGVADGTIVGHVGFPESIAMISHALGWEIDRIEETREPIVSRVKRETSHVTVEPGRTAGCMHTAVAYCSSDPVITLIHPQQIHPHLENVKTGDFIDINGEPGVHLSGSPEIPGGIATAALAVNMIPHVMNAAPGLKTMAELPVPAALLGDVRRLVKDQSWEGS
jgi:4-hydroxy-tetrahydrodipicolinate reductase